LEHINYGTKRIEYSIKRGRRKKTVAINIAPTAQVIVLAPDSLSREKIKRIVKKKARWIFEKQEFFKRLTELFPEKEFVSGEQILYLGRKYRLKIKEVHNECSSIPSLVGRRIFVTINKHLDTEEKKVVIKNALIKWYFSKSAEMIKQRIKRYCKQIDIIPSEIKIKDQKKRWGSCSNNGVLRFNWRIAMAPVSIIDYIVVHELCHLKVKNHSSDFWRLVSLILPDYEKRREWLKNNTPLFSL
jgi:predicted metal-dependent hydrolase